MTRDEVFEGVVVTIDGPAAAGKTSAAKALADRMGVPYLDSGRLYRIAGVAIDGAGADLSDCLSVAAALDRVDFIGWEDEAALRTPEADRLSSLAGASVAVRNHLLPLQREMSVGGCVAEGRDMGSVVLPKATVKFYLTARADVRATRRAAQRGTDPSDERAAISTRDARDSGRDLAPLSVPGAAVVIDSTDMTLDEVVERMFDCVLDAALPCIGAETPC